MHKMEVVAYGKWWRGRRVYRCWALHVVCLASWWAMVSAGTAPPPTSPCQPCFRGLVTTVWGFVITLISLTVDSWGSFKNVREDTTWKVVKVLLEGAALNPMWSVLVKAQDFFASKRLMSKLRGTPSAKSYIKILSGCYVFVNLSLVTYEKLRNYQHLFEDELGLEDFSDALRIGSQVEVENLLRLTLDGKEMLIRANVLPLVEQLKILQGQSGFAIVATMVQAVGYIYGVIVRMVQDLHVSLIEVIAFVLNIVVLVKEMWHFTSSSCHRPLILFLNDKNEKMFTIDCEEPFDDTSTTSNELTLVDALVVIIIFGGIIVVPFGILVFFIVNNTKFLPFKLAIPMIIIGGGLILFIGVFIVSCFEKDLILGHILASAFMSLSPILNVVSYIYALVVIVKYWSSRGFNIQSPNSLSQFLPYIG